MNVQAIFIDMVVRDVCELPDRTSPDDDPDSVIVSAKELETILENRVNLLDPPPFQQSVDAITAQLKRLNDNLEAGTLSVRTHHPLCSTPPKGDFSVRQLEVMSTFLNRAIETGALALPPREGESS